MRVGGPRVHGMDPRLAPDAFWPTLRTALEAVPEEHRRPPPDARVGAVLVLLEDTPAGPRLVLTRRRKDLRSHPGQLSFPGGRVDPGEGIVEAALREANEEIGLDADSVEVIDVGPAFYIPPSRFWVSPVLARWTSPHETTPNPWEVDRVLRVPLEQLLEEDRWRRVPLSASGWSWAWQLDDDLLWGATALVTAVMLNAAVEGWAADDALDRLTEDRTERPWESQPGWTQRAKLEGELPEVPQARLPHATAAQMKQLDDLLATEGLPLASLVEQAGRGVAQATRRMLGGSVAGRGVTVLAGSGGNGAGGLAAARLLVAAGAEVVVGLVGDARLPDQMRILHAAGVEVVEVRGRDDLAERVPGDLVVDAMVGYGADPPLRGRPEVANEWLRRSDVPVVSLDLPSGLSADIGLRGACVTADVTVTVGLPKVGMQSKITHPFVGDLYVADIGIPPWAWRKVGIDVPLDLFAKGPLVRVLVGDRASDAGTPDQGELPVEPREG